eukprot:12781815-Ditylum_brightwellii.AAC.1
MTIYRKCTLRGFSKSKMKMKKNLNMKKTTKKKKEKEDEVESKVWYFKLQKWIDHVRDASSALTWILGTL